MCVCVCVCVSECFMVTEYQCRRFWLSLVPNNIRFNCITANHK